MARHRPPGNNSSSDDDDGRGGNGGPPAKRVKRFRHKSAAQAAKEVRVDTVYRQLGPVRDAPLPGSTSFFQEELSRWRELCAAADFREAAAAVGPLSQSLPQLVHNAKEIFRILLAPLLRSGCLSASGRQAGGGSADDDGASAVLSADALAALHVALARDLQRDWLEGRYLEELSAAWALWLRERKAPAPPAPRKRAPLSSSASSEPEQQQQQEQQQQIGGGNGGKDARVLAAAFGCVGGVFRHLGRSLASVSPSAPSSSSSSSSSPPAPSSCGLARALAATRAMRLDCGAPAARLGAQAGGYLVRRACAFRGPEAAGRAAAAVVRDALEALLEEEECSPSRSSRSVASVAAAAGAVVGEACLGPKGALHSRARDVLGALLSLAGGGGGGGGSSEASARREEIAALASLEAARRVSAHVSRGKGGGALWQALLENAEGALALAAAAAEAQRTTREKRKNPPPSPSSSPSPSPSCSALSRALDLVSVAVECARGAKVEDYAPLVSLAARAAGVVLRRSEREEGEGEESPSSSLALSTSRLMAAVCDGHRRAVGASGGPLALAAEAVPQWRAFLERGPLAAAAAAARAARAALSASPNAARAAAPALLAPLARAVLKKGGGDGETHEAARLGALAELAGAAADLGGTRAMASSSSSASLSGWPVSPMLPLASCGLGPELAATVVRIAAGEEWEREEKEEKEKSSSRPGPPRRPSRLAVAAAVAAAAALPHAARSPPEAAAAARALLERATAAAELPLEGGREGEATAAELAAAEGAALRVLARALRASASSASAATAGPLSSSSASLTEDGLPSLAPRCVSLLLAHPTTPSAVSAAADVLEMAAAAAAEPAASRSRSSGKTGNGLCASAEQRDALLAALAPSLSSPSARLRSGALRALAALRPDDVGSGPLAALAPVLAGDLDVARGRAGAVALARVGEAFGRGLFSDSSSSSDSSFSSLAVLAAHALVGALSVRFAPLWPAARAALAEALRGKDFAAVWPVVLAATAEAQRGALAGEEARGGGEASSSSSSSRHGGGRRNRHSLNASAEEEEASRVRISFGDGEDAGGDGGGSDSDGDSDESDDESDDDDDDGNRADAEGGPAFAVDAFDACLGGEARLLAFLSASASAAASAASAVEGETSLTASGAVGAATRLGHLLQALSESGGGAASRSLGDWAPLYLAFAAARPGSEAAAAEAAAGSAAAPGAVVAEESDDDDDDGDGEDESDEEGGGKPPSLPLQRPHHSNRRSRSSSGFRPLGARAWRELLLNWLSVLKAAGGAVRSYSPPEKATKRAAAPPPPPPPPFTPRQLAASLGAAVGDVDGRVQSSALEAAARCLDLPWLSPALLARLRRLADDATLRRELVSFPIAVPSSQAEGPAASPAAAIPLEDRRHVLPLVARLLWPKMRRRSGRLGGRGAPGSARAACLNFLAAAAPEEAGHAVSLFVAPLAPFLLLAAAPPPRGVGEGREGGAAAPPPAPPPPPPPAPEPIAGGLFEQPWWAAELVRGERDAGWWLEAASGLLPPQRRGSGGSAAASLGGGDSSSAAASLRARLGFANAASDLLERAGHRLGPCLPAVVALVVAVYESVAIGSGVGEEEEGEGQEQQGKRQKFLLSPADAAAAREARAASLRALSSALERFPDACDWSPLWPRLLPGLSRAAERVAADAAAPGRAPALLEFVAAVAASASLAPLLADALAADGGDAEPMDADDSTPPPCPARGSAAARAGHSWAARGLGGALAASLAAALASPAAAPPARDAALRSLESLAGLGESYVREILAPHSARLLPALQGLAGAGGGGEVAASASASGSAAVPQAPPPLAGAKTRLRALAVLQSLAGASPPGPEAGAPLARALLPLLAPPRKKKNGRTARASPAAEMAAAALAAVLVRAAAASDADADADAENGSAAARRGLPAGDVAAIAAALSLPLAACPPPPAGDAARRQLLSCWQALAAGHAPALLPLVALLSDLDAASATEVGSPDYDRRLDAYAKLRVPGAWREVAGAVEEGEMEGGAKSSSSPSARLASAAVAALARRALSDLSDRGDLALRHAAASAVTALVVASAEAKKEGVAAAAEGQGKNAGNAALTSAADRVVFAAARARAAAPDAAVAQEHLLLLRALAVNDPETYPGLALLADAADEEVCFFCNAAHLQLHRRARALGKLARVFSSSADDGASSFPAGTALGVALPIIESAMLSVGGTKALASLSIVEGGGEDDMDGGASGIGGHGVSAAAASRGAAVADAAVGALSALAAAAPWRHYAQVLGRSLRLLARHPESKAAVRGVCAVVDAFHFGDRVLAASAAKKMQAAAAAAASSAAAASAEQLAAAADAADAAAAAAAARAEAEAAKAEEAARASYAEDAGITTAAAANREEEEDEEAEEEEEEGSDADEEDFVDEEAADIARALTDRALPALQRVLVCDGSVRPGVGVAIAKLVKVLPPSDVAAALPRALQSVAGLLRSRSQACRDDARRAFVQMVAALGPPYLPFALSVLSSALPPRGIFGHVAAYTAHACLSALAEAAKKKSGEEEKGEEEEAADGQRRKASSGLLEPGAFDTSLTRALEIVEGDLFGEAASERASATAAASGGGALNGGSAGGGSGGSTGGFGGGAKEVRASTGVASFELLAAGITWNRHAGTLLQSPVRDRLREAAGLPAPQRRAALATAAALLAAAVRGLARNASAAAEDRLTWAYALIKEGLDADEAARRAVSKSGQQQSAAATVEADRSRGRRGGGDNTFVVDGDVIVRPARFSGTERTAAVKAAAEAAATASGSASASGASLAGVAADAGAALLFAEAGLACVCRELKLSPAPDAALVDALLPLLVRAMRCRSDDVARGALKAVAAATVRYARRRRDRSGKDAAAGGSDDDELDASSPLLPGLAAAAPAAASNAAALLRRAPDANSPSACAALAFLATLWRLPGGGRGNNNSTHALPAPNPEAARAVLRVAFSLSGSSSSARAPPLPSAQALEVFRALAGRRVLVPEMYDAAGAAQRAAVAAGDAAARARASRALLAFLLDCPLGPRRLAAHVERAAADLEYEHADGREGAADLLRAVAGAFPREALAEWAPAVAVPLSARLVAEPEPGPRAAARRALAALFARVPEETADKLAGFSVSWLDGGKKGSTKKKKGGGARARAGALALELQIRAEAAAASKALNRPSSSSSSNSLSLAAVARRHAALALPAAMARLESIADEEEEDRERRRREEEEEREEEEAAAARAAAGSEEEEEGEAAAPPPPTPPAPLPAAPARWSEAYACLCLLEACADVSSSSSSSSAAAASGGNNNNANETQLPLPLAALVAAARLSLYPHAWVRRSASRLVGRALAAELSSSSSSKKGKGGAPSFVAAAGGARTLARRALAAAQHPSAWEDAGLLAQACKNVVALAPALFELDEAEGLFAEAEKEKEEKEKEEEEGGDASESDDDRDDRDDGDDDNEEDGKASPSTGLTLLSLCRAIARMAQDRRHGSEPQAAAALRLSAALAARLGPERCSRGALLRELCVPLFRLTEGGAPCSPEIAALAAQVVDALRGSSSSSSFLEAYAAARAAVLRRRGARRREAALLAVADPAAAARARLAKQARRAGARKKRMAEVARLRAAGIRVKNQKGRGGGGSNSRRGGKSRGGGLREEY